jgi:hypothetical protein
LENPKSQNSPYSVSCFEQVSRNYDLTQATNSSLIFDVPQEYDESNWSLSVHVKASSVTENIIENSEAGAVSRFEQAQSFPILSVCELDSIALFMGPSNKQNSFPTIQIRNETYDGEILFSTVQNLSFGWNTINITTRLTLTPGIYFVRMTALTSPSLKAWYASPVGDNHTETWIKDTTWQLANYDLTLKTYVREILTPQSVNLTINGILAQNTESDAGIVSIPNYSITNPVVNFEYQANTSIELTYSATVTLIRTSYAPVLITTSSITPTGEILLQLAQKTGMYYNYFVIITGLCPDWSNFVPKAGEHLIGFNYILDNSALIMDEAPEIITFQTINHIEGISLPSLVYAGETVQIDISRKSTVVPTITIAFNGSILETFMLSPENASQFQYYINPTFFAGIYTIEAGFSNGTSVGFANTTFELRKECEIRIDPITVDALDRLNLQCEFIDSILKSEICNAQLDYSINDLYGALNYNDFCIYATNIDLNLFALTPGNYTINLRAQKTGYRTISTIVPLTIQFRQLGLLLSQSTSKVQPGESVKFQVSMFDMKTNTSLLRPVDLKLSLRTTGANGTEFEVMSEWIYSCVRNCELDWIVPNTVQFGNYDVVIEVFSEYYSGSYRAPQSVSVFMVDKRDFTMYYLIGVVGIAFGFSSFIQREKQAAKHSLSGMMIVSEQGTPIADLISEEFAIADPVLIAGAVTGMMSLIKEITGKGLHTIEIEGGYVNIIKIKSYWIIIFLKKHPWWIKRDIFRLCDQFDRKYGQVVADFQGKLPDIQLDSVIKSQFGQSTAVLRGLRKIEEKRKQFMTESDIQNKN